MLIDFDALETSATPNFKGGEGELISSGHTDSTIKILRAHLEQGSTVGLHTHETSSETIYILSGTATAIVDGKEEQLHPGVVTYCPKDSTHTIVDVCPEGLDFLAIVPELQ